MRLLPRHPACPDRGCASRTSASSSAFVPVAMTSASAGVYQRASLANSSPWRRASAAGEEDVGAPGRLDLVLPRQPVGVSVPANTSIAFARSCEPGGNASASSSGNGWSAQPDAPLGDQPGGRLVHQVAVLDALHAGGDRPLDRGGRVGMHGDVGAPVLGGFNGGAQLGLGEGGSRRAGCGATPRRHPPSA